MKRITSRLGRGRTFMFRPPTKGFEILNTILLIGFSTSFLTNGDYLITKPMYINMLYIDNPWFWSAIFWLGIFQFVILLRSDLVSNILSSFTLKVSGCIYGIFAALFTIKLGIPNTGFTTYASLAFLMVAAGFELSAENVCIQLQHVRLRNKDA